VNESCTGRGRSPLTRRRCVVNVPRGEDKVSQGDEKIAGRSEGITDPIACPKCGSSRTAVTVNIVDDAGKLTLYSCGTCDHRFSRSPR